MFESHGFEGGVMWLFWILIVVAFIWFIAFAARSAGGPSGHEKSALEILKQRYARGEIDQQEFEQKRTDLDS